jgi:hypothetical protein
MLRRFLVLAVLLSLGCRSSVKGNEGNFRFSYWSGDWTSEFDKPVAVGAYLDLAVRGVGSLASVDLSEADFDDPSVLDVTSFSGEDITIQGIGEGVSLLQVEGTLKGEILTDSVDMEATIPEVLEMSHTCTEAEDAAYLIAHEVVIGFEMAMSDSQTVIGYGYYPVELTATAATVSHDSTSLQWITFNTGDMTEDALLLSTIDESSLSIHIGSESDIDDIEEPIDWSDEEINVGDTNPFYVRPSLDNRVVCQGDVSVSVISDTPGVCEIEAYNKLTDDQHESGWFAIAGLAEGTCLYSVTYPGGAAGAGVSRQFSHGITP